MGSEAAAPGLPVHLLRAAVSPPPCLRYAGPPIYPPSLGPPARPLLPSPPPPRPSSTCRSTTLSLCASPLVPTSILLSPHLSVSPNPLSSRASARPLSFHLLCLPRPPIPLSLCPPRPPSRPIHLPSPHSSVPMSIFRASRASVCPSFCLPRPSAGPPLPLPVPLPPPCPLSTRPVAKAPAPLRTSKEAEAQAQVAPSTSQGEFGAHAVRSGEGVPRPEASPGATLAPQPPLPRALGYRLRDSLSPGLSQGGLWAAASASPGSLSGMQIPGPHRAFPSQEFRVRPAPEAPGDSGASWSPRAVFEIFSFLTTCSLEGLRGDKEPRPLRGCSPLPSPPGTPCPAGVLSAPQNA